MNSALYGGNTWFIVVGALGMLFMFASGFVIYLFLKKKMEEEQAAVEEKKQDQQQS